MRLAKGGEGATPLLLDENGKRTNTTLHVWPSRAPKVPSWFRRCVGLPTFLLVPSPITKMAGGQAQEPRAYVPLGAGPATRDWGSGSAPRCSTTATRRCDPLLPIVAPVGRHRPTRCSGLAFARRTMATPTSTRKFDDEFPQLPRELLARVPETPAARSMSK
jgi:hypothetical protein